MPDGNASSRPSSGLGRRRSLRSALILLCSHRLVLTLGVNSGIVVRRITQPRYSSSVGEPQGDLTAVRQCQFGEDVLYVVLGGALGKDQPFGDLPVREPLPHELGDLVLARRQW